MCISFASPRKHHRFPTSWHNNDLRGGISVISQALSGGLRRTLFGTSSIIETHLQCVSFLIRIVFVVCQGVHLKRRQQSSTAQQRAKECLISRVSHVLSFGQRVLPKILRLPNLSHRAMKQWKGCSAGV